MDIGIRRIRVIGLRQISHFCITGPTPKGTVLHILGRSGHASRYSFWKIRTHNLSHDFITGSSRPACKNNDIAQIGGAVIFYREMRGIGGAIPKMEFDGNLAEQRTFRSLLCKIKM
jgi:hypothetical protein